MKSLLRSKKIQTVLVTCHSLEIYSGSEMVTLDVASLFKSQGVEVVCAAFVTGNPAQQLFTARGIEVVNLVDKPELMLEQSFDLIWAHHWPVLGFCLTELGVRYRHLVCSSLSAYEPLEMISMVQSIADIVVCNSTSTKVAHLDDICAVEETKLQVLNNSLNDEWFENENTVSLNTCVKKLGIISNHVPFELKAAVELLQLHGVVVTLIGMETKQCLVDIKLIQSFDAVITIGHSVQKCLAVGVPVYCYDRFGGPGWISSKNIDTAEFYNFSGRCCFRQLTADEIDSEILEGYKEASNEARALRAVAQERYDLLTNLSQIIQCLKIELQPKQLSPGNNSLRKLTQLYLREKFEFRIPSTVNIDARSLSTESSLFKILYLPDDEKVMRKHFAYFGVNPFSDTVHWGLSGVFVSGVALGKGNYGPVVEVAIYDGSVKVAKVKPSVQSPGIGKQFTDIENSSESGFQLSLGGGSDSGTYNLNVSFQNGKIVPVGRIEVTKLKSIAKK